ncbi:hypothetical protein RHSIM_Rhsim07G0030700 [Rhododendron simsii]|uniref:Uncharacterized protein n=1 Tax=Rhododendron simsii TaxID=118357 RepID=A0A834GNE7_RHOSS|nr:hypothetical protein RHSIM_Rhsim07G0030700 [Rhododendron simsii]
MSVVSSLFLFLLCVSFHSCYGRHLAAIGKEPETKSLLPLENDETTSTPAAGDGEGMVNQISRVEKEDDHKPLKATKKMKGQGEGMENISSGAVKTDPSKPSNVSWHVPHKERGEEQQPGFNLDYDYAPPLTHPPVHN